MDRTAFERHVQAAIDALPVRIRDHLNDVSIVVEDRPKRPVKGLLLGLYEGIPVTEWGKGFAEVPTDKITLYQEHIEAYAESEEDIPHVIRETLQHELAHHFGYGHDRIHTMEKRWKNQRESR
jgi:predicted Zn-dependent protease with MMP-like domain